MATNTSTSSGLSNRTNLYAERELLKNQAPVVVLDKFGMQKQMPKNKTTTIKFRRAIPFTAETIPLQEGVTPSNTPFAYEDVEGTLEQYGQVSDITDVIEDTNEDAVLNDMVVELGQNIGRTREALCWAAFRAGTNVFFANGTARNQVNTPITQTRIRAAVRALKAQKAHKITKVLSSSPDFQTRAIEASYICVAHTDLENDIRNLPGFIPCASYGVKKMCSDYELGSVDDVRFILSPDLESFPDAGGAQAGSGSSTVSTTGTNSDVYPMLIFGEQAFGHVSLRGMGAVSPSIIPVGQKTKDDPLGQIGKAGWKMWHLALILNQLWMARIEVAASELV